MSCTVALTAFVVRSILDRLLQPPLITKRVFGTVEEDDELLPFGFNPSPSPSPKPNPTTTMETAIPMMIYNFWGDFGGLTSIEVISLVSQEVVETAAAKVHFLERDM